MTTKRHLTYLFTAATFAAVLSACSSTSGGTPLPVTSPSAPSATTASSGNPSNVFGSLKACPVLDKALEGQGFTPAVAEQAGGDNGCKAGKVRTATVGVTLQPDAGIDDLNADPSKVHSGHINGRPAKQIREAIGAKGDCMIVIEVTKTSRAIVTASMSTGTTEEACALATSIAEKVEPQLPKNN
jgi:hypothetical protein